MIAALWIVDLPLQALQRAEVNVPDDTAAWGVVDNDEYHGGTPLLHLSAAARDCGLIAGMTLAQARARLPEFAVEPRRAALEASAVQALADVAHSFSPRYELGENRDLGWAFVDVEGLESLVGPPDTIAAALASALRKVGLEGRVGLARTKTLARLVARGGDGCSALPEQTHAERQLVAELPLVALEPSAQLHDTLLRFGLRSAGDLLLLGDTDPGALAERLGPEGMALYHTACGREAGVGLEPQPARDSYYEGVELDYAIIELEPLAFLLRGMLDRLVTRLRLRGLRAGDVHLSFEYEGLGGCERIVEVGAPSRDVRSLLELCRLRLEKDPPQQPVNAIGVNVQARGTRAHQLSFFEPVGPRPDELAVTVARLTALCGDDRVGSPRPLDSYADDAFAVEPFTAAPTAVEPYSAPTQPTLSLRRFRPPRQISVSCYAGKPARLEGAGLGGRVVTWSGPFRRSAGWWQPDRGARADVYDVQLADGVYYRLQFEPRQQQWWALGWYD